MKKQASATNGHDVQLRALEREAKAQRDLLESYLAKYREATARENIDAAPADGRIISRATVSNTPAYPKKLPIVLIATLATLLLTSGAIATGELLRMTAPRASAAVTSALTSAAAPMHVSAPPVAPYFEPHEDAEPEDAKLEDVMPDDIRPAVSEPRDELAAGIDEIEQLADRLGQAGEAARKVTVLGTATSEGITLTALTLARLMARQAKIVVVDLAASSPTMTAVSVDPAAPGLAELMQGEASFAQVITKDRLSRVHLVSAGRPGFDRSQLQSPRLTLAIDALLRVYDHVAARCRWRIRPAGGTADRACPRGRGARSLDGFATPAASCAISSEPSASPTSRCCASRASRRMPSNAARAWWRRRR